MCGVQGLYVRLLLGTSKQTNEVKYLVCEVVGVRDKSSEDVVLTPCTPLFLTHSLLFSAHSVSFTPRANL